MILGPESESKFLSAGVTVWSPKFSEPGDRVRVRQKTMTLHSWLLLFVKWTTYCCRMNKVEGYCVVND